MRSCCVLLFLLAACGGGGDDGGDTSVPEVSVTPDTLPDAADDVAMDLGVPEVADLSGSDGLVDLVMDVALDAAAEVGVDTGVDAGVDTGKDTVQLDTPGPDTVQEPFFLTDVTALALPALTGYSRYAAALDPDGDGAMDIVLSVDGDHDLVLVNDGAGVFSASQLPTGQDATTCIEVFDLDGDGPDDLFVGKANLPCQVLEGTDGGGFADVTEAVLGDFNYQVERALPGDLDGDDDIDLIVLCSGSQQERMLLNQGGTLVDVTAERMPEDSLMTASGSLGAVDSDGALDLVFTCFINSQTTRLWRNDGAGFFTDESEKVPAFEAMGFDAVLADLNQDGISDLFEVNNWAPQRVLLGDGSGSFSHFPNAISSATGPFGNGSFMAVDAALGDLTKDGITDVVLACSGNTEGLNRNVLLTGNGNGSFAVDETIFPEDGLDTRHVLLFDADGDGDLEVFFSNALGQSRIYWNGTY